MQIRNALRMKRKTRIQVKGNASRPRISVYKSLTAIYAQLVDDETGKTIAAASSKELKSKQFNIEAAKETGKLLAKKANDKGIKAAVYDRGGYPYHGKIKALADGAREGGLEF